MQINYYVNDELEDTVLEEYDTIIFDSEVGRILDKIRNRIQTAGANEGSVNIYIEEEED